MKTSIQRGDGDVGKSAPKRLPHVVLRYRIAIVGVIVVGVTVVIVFYYRNHEPKAVWLGNLTVMKSDTGRLSDEVTITLNELKKRPDQSEVVVTAKVECKGLPEMRIGNATVGYVVTYPKEHGYKIEILSADSASAKFSISKYP